ncbi:MAG: pentapeptide repeat-containing protein [Anaerolineaceae bacterium]|nr:pentapeptide repeat-containing protein [Anaerolineaceae bacterium]
MAQKIREPQGYPTKDAAQRANDDMWRSFKKQFQEKPITYGMVFALFGFVVGAVMFHHQPDWGDTNNYLFNYLTISLTVGLGVLVTVFVLNELQKRREKNELSRQLLIDIQYGANDVALNAINRLRGYDEDYGWLTSENSIFDGKLLRAARLQGSKLSKANFSNARLQGANFQQARLRRANFQGANLNVTNLRNADLRFAQLEGVPLHRALLQKAYLNNANLKDANLHLASLEEADLRGTNLAGSSLYRTNLSGANLSNCSLVGAYLEEAEFSTGTVLPDAKVIEIRDSQRMYDKYYESDQGPSQMLRYTDPHHPDFWQPDWVKDKEAPSTDE